MGEHSCVTKIVDVIEAARVLLKLVDVAEFHSLFDYIDCKSRS